MKQAPQEFVSWLQAEMNSHNWSSRETARRAGISHPLILDILNFNKQPSFKTCVVLARIFNLAPEDVVRRAGLLPPVQETDAKKETLLHLYEQMSPEDRNELIEIARLKAARGKK